VLNFSPAIRGSTAWLLSLCGLSGLPLHAEEIEEQLWYDTGREAVMERADDLAGWVDHFFGLPDHDRELASSFIRLRPQVKWDEQDDVDWKLRATGQLQLPALSDRVSLVFSGDGGDIDEEIYDPALSDGDSSLGVKILLDEDKRSRVDLLAGFKAGPKGKVGARYRYQRPFLERNRFRFSEELFWIGGDGFGTLSRVDIDHRLNERDLLRWANRVEYSEESNGAEWNTRLAWVRRIDERSAIRGFGFLRGDTSPERLKSRGFGASYRRQFLRDWLYWELEPRYAWRKGKRDTDREGVASVRLRFEIVIGDKPRFPADR
jgi:hypothetical protein